jgi:hypothetical protein
MSDEPVIPVVSETPVIETPVVETVVETPPVVTTGSDESQEPSSLAPGGDRFKQVWARAKSAEAKLEAQTAELQREREERIRLEERTKVQAEEKKKAEPEWNWEQLEGFIAEGKITRAGAAEYREKLVAEKATLAAEQRLEAKLQSTSQQTTVQSEVDRYKRAVPEVMQPGSVERVKVEREYVYLTQTLGYPGTRATELAAMRAALGDPDTVERAAQAKQTSNKEPFMETHSSSHKPTANGKDLIKGLDDRSRKHYEKMIEHGRYSGWEEVRAELAWEKPSLAVKRG